MNTYSENSKENKSSAVATSLQQNKIAGNSAIQLVDNRILKPLSHISVPVKQLKSYQATVDFNTNKTIQRFEEHISESEEMHHQSEPHHETEPLQMTEKTNTNSSSKVFQLVNRLNFTAEQRRKLLAKNRVRNGGYHTCTHCGFRHANVHYATYRGRRIGDGQFHIDHILHASRGGRNLMRNGRVLCGTCNTSRGNRLHIVKTGRVKYRGLHGKKVSKDYYRKPR